MENTADCIDPQRSARIAKRNDMFRKVLIPVPWAKLIFSHAVSEYDDEMKGKVITALREFNDFKEGDDPYGEHDFGAFEVDDIKHFFKFDYYHKSMEYGEDPESQDCIRVLTVMQAEEY